jgi:methionine sulfoxide reductase heme-binding subunit
MNSKRSRSRLVFGANLLVHILSLLPMVVLVLDALQNNLGFNPVQAVLIRTGRSAVILLLLSLTCTPLHKIFHLPFLKKLRKPLGLYAALYAFLHFAAFAAWDYRFDLSLIWREIIDKPFIFLGLAALIILGILAITSFPYWQRKLGKSWFWLHRLAYVAGALAVTHYLLAVKGDLLSLQGNYTMPLIAGVVLLIGFGLRLPVIYQPLRRLFSKQTTKQ